MNRNNTLVTIGLFIAAFALALLIMAFVFQQYEVDGPSMQPTLQNKNRLIVVKVQRSWARLTGHSWIPARDNIIVFNQANVFANTGNPEKQLIKRVIGLPGDTVVIKNGNVTIFNKQNPKGFNPDVNLPYGKVNEPTTSPSGSVDFTVPANEVYVMGDNRPDSYDSRYFGPVQVNNIIGKLDVRIYPFNEMNLF